MVVDLSGRWQFRTGDHPDWKQRKVRTADWDEITVPGFWEAQGFESYNGYAWYRKSFYLPEKAGMDQTLYLLLGKVDDMDETFINGFQIGSTGNLESRNIQDGNPYRTARIYPIPAEILQPGDYNLLSVRVYDGSLDGGIYEGPIGIITRDEVYHRQSLWWRMWQNLKDLLN